MTVVTKQLWHFCKPYFSEKNKSYSLTTWNLLSLTNNFVPLFLLLFFIGYSEAGAFNGNECVWFLEGLNAEM